MAGRPARKRACNADMSTPAVSAKNAWRWRRNSRGALHGLRGQDLRANQSGCYLVRVRSGDSHQVGKVLDYVRDHLWLSAAARPEQIAWDLTSRPMRHVGIEVLVIGISQAADRTRIPGEPMFRWSGPLNRNSVAVG